MSPRPAGAVATTETCFYDWKRWFQLDGLDGLKDLPPIAKGHPMTTPVEVVARIEALALVHPAMAATGSRRCWRWRGGGSRRSLGRIGGQLEAPNAMRCQAGRLPDLIGLGRLHAAHFRHGAHRPMGRFVRQWLVQSPLNHLGDLPLGQRGNARRPGLVAQQSLDARLEVALLPRHTDGLLRPVRRMIPAVPTRSAVSSTISARQACFRAQF
jgi:hypothetical protein